MRGAVAILAALGLFLSSCSADDNYSLATSGIGTELYSPGLPNRARNLEVYAGFICYEASIPYDLQGIQPVCNYSAFRSGDWNSFVQMGVADIDQRCDSYLQWLDSAKRRREPVTNQLAGTGRLTNQILALTGASVGVLNAVSVAFGYASDTYLNIQSSLLIELDHSTVQSVVYGVQTRLKDEIASRPVSSKPEAIQILRTYLRSCMPFTISTEVNTQLSALGRGAPVTGDLLTTETIPFRRFPSKPLDKPGRTPAPEGIEAYSVILDPDLLKNNLVGAGAVRQALAALCVKTTPTSRPDVRTTRSIQWYKSFKDANTPENKRELLTYQNIQQLNDDPRRCSKNFPRNWFEKVNFPQGGLAADALFIKKLNEIVPDAKLTAASNDTTVRATILVAKRKKGINLEFEDEVDQALYDNMGL
ncbi:hypothetical protein [Rhizobium leguminosarum]|uniref:hypothetical protein n=1 Tax=Rhizobium leguminosarum TaxID=384 RepID=UPI001C983254|nr:hypothetical protein [Rhizobium leguminosarum]MBY5515656.1 hypothetical protein [Rhizobium leguminosarum]